MVISKMSGLFKSAYEPKNLLKTNVAASGILLLLGDIIQQNIELYRGVHEKGEERMVTKTSACNDDISLDPNTFTSHPVTWIQRKSHRFGQGAHVD